MRHPFIAVGLALALALSGPFAPDAGAKGRPVQRLIQTKGEPGPAVGAPDPNVSDDSELNSRSPLEAFPRPPEKGGARPRGSYCVISVDNYTPHMVKVYVDGELRGSVPRWGRLTLGAITGPTRLYAKASFDDGTTMSWPNKVTCEGNKQYTWKLQE